MNEGQKAKYLKLIEKYQKHNAYLYTIVQLLSKLVVCDMDQVFKISNFIHEINGKNWKEPQTRIARDAMRVSMLWMVTENEKMIVSGSIDPQKFALSLAWTHHGLTSMCLKDDPHRLLIIQLYEKIIQQSEPELQAAGVLADLRIVLGALKVGGALAEELKGCAAIDISISEEITIGHSDRSNQAADILSIWSDPLDPAALHTQYAELFEKFKETF